MSGENIVNSKLENIEVVSNSKPKRVDINDLLSKVREEKKKERKESLVFFGLISTVVVVTGIIASL